MLSRYDMMIIMLILLFFFFAVILIVSRMIKMAMIEMKEDNFNKLNEFRAQLSNSNTKFLKDVVNIYNQNDNNENIDLISEQKHHIMHTFKKLKLALLDNCLDCMNKMHSARIAIYLMHNGTHSINGIHFIKTTCICEKIARGSGIKERVLEHSNIPVNLFDDMINSLNNNGYYIIYNNDETYTTNQRIFISSPKITYSHTVALFDNENNMLGFVVAEMTNPYNVNDIKNEKEILQILADQVVPILTFANYKDMTQI